MLVVRSGGVVEKGLELALQSCVLAVDEDLVDDVGDELLRPDAIRGSVLSDGLKVLPEVGDGLCHT